MAKYSLSPGLPELLELIELSLYTREQLLGLAKLAEKHNLYLISDEVYKDFIFSELS